MAPRGVIWVAGDGLCYTTGPRVMFNIGFGELAIICIVLIIAVGPERLPSMMKTLGKTMRTLRQASRDIRASTGIDELLREDLDLNQPIRRRPPERPAGPAPVSRSDIVDMPLPRLPLTAGDPMAPAAAAEAQSVADAHPATINTPATPELPHPIEPPGPAPTLIGIGSEPLAPPAAPTVNAPATPALTPKPDEPTPPTHGTPPHGT
jgi:sec-independent protein translocase protein TatB